jgi:hypothetical protein
MPIFRVWQVKRGNQVLIAGDQAVGDSLIHFLSGSLETLRIDVLPLQKATYPLVMNSIRPTCPEQSGSRELH